MKRIGNGGEGYDKLEGEFNANLETSMNLLHTILSDAPEDDLRHFNATYFSMTQEALGGYLDLLSDLSWYKNWLIDHT